MMDSSFISFNGIKNAAFIFAFMVGTQLGWEIFKNFNSKKKRQVDCISCKPIAETFFFSEQSEQCKHHIGDGVTPCELLSCPVNCINKLVAYLNTATRSVDICVYFLSFNRLGRAIIDLHRKNIIVRVIADDEAKGHNSSFILNLRREGVPVRTKKMINNLMHHKFAIVDRKLLISGSANWTQQAFTGNCDNIIVSNQTQLVEPFINEFEKLWVKFSIPEENNPQEKDF